MSEFGACGVVGGMAMIELLAYTMRSVRGRIAAVEDDMRQTYTVKHIRKGLTLLSYQWGVGSIDAFIDRARCLGIDIEKC